MAGWLRVGICFGLAVMLISLLISGEISLFVNPRFKWLMGVSVLLLIILGLVQMWNIKGGEMHRIGFWGYALVMLPVLMFIFLPPKALDASMAAKKGVTFITPQTSQQNQATPREETFASEEEVPVEVEPEIELENPYKELLQKIKTEPIITLTEKNYADYLNTISLYSKEVEGKKIRLIGFVYRDDTLKKNEFVTGRFTVTCCTADATVVGFITSYKQSDQFKLNQWIEVTGTLKNVLYDGYDMPVVELESYRIIDPPKDPYIYFY